MKILDWLGIQKGLSNKKDAIRKYYFIVNGIADEKYIIYSYRLHSNNYKEIRSFKTQQYEKGYLFRNCKGFNTMGCIIKYDIIVANVKGEVIDSFQQVEQGFTSDFYKNGFYVLFVPVGTINYFNIKERDVISFKNVKNIY